MKKQHSILKLFSFQWNFLQHLLHFWSKQITSGIIRGGEIFLTEWLNISAVLSLIWNADGTNTPPFRKFIAHELRPTLLSGNAKKLLLHIHWTIDYLEITWDLRTNSPGLEAHLCHYVAIYMWKSYKSTGFLSSTWKWVYKYLL